MFPNEQLQNFLTLRNHSFFLLSALCDISAIDVSPIEGNVRGRNDALGTTFCTYFKILTQCWVSTINFVFKDTVAVPFSACQW